jgi:hypothetical protein
MTDPAHRVRLRGSRDRGSKATDESRVWCWWAGCAVRGRGETVAVDRPCEPSRRDEASEVSS